MELLPDSCTEVIATVTATNTFHSESKRGLIKAFNELLARRDFYSESVFALIPLPDKARQLIKLDPKTLPADELIRLNRHLLEACFPEAIKTNLADIESNSRLPYFRFVAENIVQEFKRIDNRFDHSFEQPLDGLEEISFEEWLATHTYEQQRTKEHEIGQRELIQYFAECLKECSATHEPWKRELLLLYYEEDLKSSELSRMAALLKDEAVESEVDEILANRTIDVRKVLADKLGVSQGYLRLMIKRIKDELKPCLIRCMLCKGFTETEFLNNSSVNRETQSRKKGS
jgi:hypothetical protein